MKVTLVYVALFAVASGLPAHVNWNKLNTHESTKDIMDYIENIFEKTCHNLCLKRFPEAGPAQDKCMSICHRKHPDSSHSEMNDMDETSDTDGMGDKDNMDGMTDHTM